MSNLGGELFEPPHLESLDKESFDKIRYLLVNFSEQSRVEETLVYFMNG